MRGARPFAALEAHVAERVALQPGEIVLAAVSGGPDSVALAALLARAVTAASATLVLAHVNHGIRDAAWQDEAVVLALATRLRVRVVIRSLPPGPASEARLREERYGLLSDIAREVGARRVFAAHHAEDQTETVLLALFRGTGPAGLLAMQRSRALGPDLSLERPLLGVEPRDLRGYCAGEHLACAVDATNDDLAYRRNAVRFALDELRGTFPHLDRAVARCIGILEAERAGAPRAELRERLRAELCLETGDRRDVSFERLDAAARAVERGTSGRHFLRRGVELITRTSGTSGVRSEIAAIEFDAASIALAVGRLAAAIAKDARGEPVTLVGVLKGALFLTADLARALPAGIDATIDFIAVSSYGNSARSSVEVRLLKDTSESVEGKNVVIVEDIVDNGLTLHYLQGLLAGRKPASLRTCVLLDKPYRRSVNVPMDYIGLTAPDAFIVGYGLDYQEKYRNLPYLARLHNWVFEAATPRSSKGIG